MHKALLLLAALLAGCGGGDAPVRTVQAAAPQTVVALGDSITRRTGICPAGESLAECIERDHIASATSYATHLAAASGWSITLLDNQGRGGDTCTDQPAWASGPHAGQARGIAARLDAVIAQRPTTVLLLAGINDALVWGVPVAEVVACVAGVREQLQAQRVRVVVLTYPPIDPATPVFTSADRLARLAALNAGLRGIGAIGPAYWPDWAAPHLTTDGTHPSAGGAVWMASAITRAMGVP